MQSYSTIDISLILPPRSPKSTNKSNLTTPPSPGEFPDCWILSGDLYELEQALKQFMCEYNNIRPHKSLNYETPVGWYNKRAA